MRGGEVKLKKENKETHSAKPSRDTQEKWREREGREAKTEEGGVRNKLT